LPQNNLDILDRAPLLNTGTTLANLKFSGTMPELNEKLNSISKGLEITNFSFLRMDMEVLKGPEDLLQ
jgi:hypothetical protein